MEFEIRVVLARIILRNIATEYNDDVIGARG